MPIEYSEPDENTVAIDEVIAHVKCSSKSCNARVGDPCKNKNGEVATYVHQPRINAYLNWRAQQYPDQREADIDKAREMAYAAAPVIQGRLGPQLHQPAIVGDARLNWMARYEMVRGVFRIMSRIDPNGAEGALDYLARLVVEMDLDLKILDEAKAQVEGQ